MQFTKSGQELKKKYSLKKKYVWSSDGHSLCHSGNGIREWSGNRCVFGIPREFSFPFPFPQNSLGGGVVIRMIVTRARVTIFPPRKKAEIGLRPTQWLKLEVTVVRGKGWGLSSSLFSEKKTFILERLEHLQKSWFFDANYLSDSLAIPKTNCVHSQSSFEFPIPLPIPSKFWEKRMSYFPIPIPSWFKGMTIAGFRFS